MSKRPFFLKVTAKDAEQELCTPNGTAGLHIALNFHGCVSSFLRFEFSLAGKNSTFNC